MAIRQDIIVDPTLGIKGLDEFERAAIKSARKQEGRWKENQQALKALQKDIRRLEQARDAANNPRMVQKYQNAIDELEKEQKQLRKETEKYGNAVKKTGKTTEGAFKKIGRSAKLWIAGAAAGALLYVMSLLRDMGGEMTRFNEEMNKSLAIQGNVTLEQRNRMEKAAKEVSRELNIALDQVAKGYFYLASAGLSAEQQIANLPQVAEFAKAGMFDLATATDLATDAQSALGLTVENTAENQRNLIRVTDVLTKANTVSNATIQQFSEALTNKAGTRLRQFNKDVEEGVSVLAAYADQGVKGRLAGERLNILYRELARTYRENTEAYEEYGIAIFDGNGEMRNTATILAEMEEAFGDMSAETKAATLSQLGFTSESQDSINAILGMSEEIRGYEQDLRSAAGTTEEVANEQLKSLTERLGLLKRQLIDTFGDDVVSAIEATVRGLETLYRLVRGTQEEIQKESIIQGALDRSGVSRPNISGPYSDSFRDKLEKLYDQQRKNTEEFNRQNREMAESIASYSTWASTVEGASEKVQDANEELLFRELVIKKNIERNEELIDSEETAADQKAKLILKNEALANKLASVQEQISKTRDYLNQTTQEEQEQEEQVENLANSYDQALRKFGQFQDHLNDIVSLSRQAAGSAGLGGLPTIISEINKEFDKLSSGNVIGAQMKGAARNVREYNQALTEAHNELRSGAITQEQYEQKVKQATDTFLDQVKEIYKTIKNDLSPEQEDMFETWLSGVEDATESGEGFKTNLDDIADTADAILNVADAFGAIGDNARKSLRGISDVLRNVQKIRELQSAGNLTALSGAMPAIGVAGGIMSMISGVISSSGMGSAEIKELENEMNSLVRALDKNTEAILEQALSGANVSQAQLEQAQELLSQMEGVLSGESLSNLVNFDFAGKELEDKASRSFIEDALSPLFDQLSETGIEAFEDIDSDWFMDIVRGISGENVSFVELERALDGVINGIDDLEGMSDIVETLTDNLGQFGDSLEGAIEQFNVTTKLGMDAGEAFDRFIQDVIGLVGEDNEVTKLLEQIAEAESPEGRKELANQLWEAFQDNPALLGSDLTGSDLQEIIDMILGQEGAAGSGSEGFSRSVQIARTITDVQANEIVMFLERIEKWTRDIAAAMGSETAITVNQTGGFSSFDLQIPLPVTIVDDLPDGESTTVDQRSRVTKNFNFSGPIDIGDEITGQDIDELTRAMAHRLKQELRGGQF